MVFASAEIILFGIQAGVRLAGAARQAYIDKTREREVTLALPGIDHVPNVGQAQNYFGADPAGIRHLAESARLRELHARVNKGRPAFERDKAAVDEYLESYEFFRNVDKGVKAEELTPYDIVAATTISQWGNGKSPNPTALQRVAGTLVEIGVDYFSVGPGKSKLTGNGASKRMLREVLGALDDQSFSTDGLDGVVETMFMTVLDCIAEDSSLVSGDEKVQKFVGAAAKGLVSDVKARLESLGEGERFFASAHFADSAGLVLRSLVRHGVGHAVANPATLLSVEDAAEGAVISRIGAAVLDTILPSAGSGVDLGALGGADGIDRLVRTSLALVAEHPQLLGLVPGDGTEKKSVLHKLIRDVAGDLSNSPHKMGLELLPDLTQMVLEHTAGNLSLMWSAEEDDVEHLLVTGVGALLSSLAKKPGNDQDWSLVFSRQTILDVAEKVVDEVAANPAMVTGRIGNNIPVQMAIDAALRELGKLELAEVSSASVSRLLEVSVRAAAGRMDFLDQIKIGSGAAKAAAGHVLETVLAAAFPHEGTNVRSSWVLARSSVLEAVTEIAFAELGKVGVDADRIAVLESVLADVVSAIENRQAFSVEGFADQLATALLALPGVE